MNTNLHMDHFANLKAGLEQMSRLPDGRERGELILRTREALRLWDPRLDSRVADVIMTSRELRGNFRILLLGLDKMWQHFFERHEHHAALNKAAFQVPFVHHEGFNSLAKTLCDVAESRKHATSSSCIVQLIGARQEGKSRSILQLTERGVTIVYVNSRSEGSPGMPSRTNKLANFLEHCTQDKYNSFLVVILEQILSFYYERSGASFEQVSGLFTKHMQDNTDEILSQVKRMSISCFDVTGVIAKLIGQIRSARESILKRDPGSQNRPNISLTLLVFDHVSGALSRNSEVITNGLKLIPADSDFLALWINPDVGSQPTPKFFKSIPFAPCLEWPEPPAGTTWESIVPGGFRGPLVSSAGVYAHLSMDYTKISAAIVSEDLVMDVDQPAMMLDAEQQNMVTDVDEHNLLIVAQPTIPVAAVREIVIDRIQSLINQHRDPRLPHHQDINLLSHFLRVSTGTPSSVLLNRMPPTVMLPVVKVSQSTVWLDMPPNTTYAIWSLLHRLEVGENVYLREFIEMPGSYRLVGAVAESLVALLILTLTERAMKARVPAGTPLRLAFLNGVPEISLAETFHELLEKLPCAAQHEELRKDAIEYLSEIRHQVIHFGQLLTRVLFSHIAQSAEGGYGYIMHENEPGVDFVLGAKRGSQVVNVLGQVKCWEKGVPNKEFELAFEMIDDVAARMDPLKKMEFISIVFELGCKTAESVIPSYGPYGLRLHFTVPTIGKFICPEDDEIAQAINDLLEDSPFEFLD